MENLNSDVYFLKWVIKNYTKNNQIELNGNVLLLLSIKNFKKLKIILKDLKLPYIKTKDDTLTIEKISLIKLILAKGTEPLKNYILNLPYEIEEKENEECNKKIDMLKKYYS